jgi:gentisate 1,2-dioxygenase
MSNGSMIWLDGLDVLVVNHLSVAFDQHGEDTAPTRPDSFSTAAVGRSLVQDAPPMPPTVPAALHALRLRHPFTTEARAALDALAAAGPRIRATAIGAAMPIP